MTTPKAYLCPHTRECSGMPCCEDCERIDQYLDLNFNRRLAFKDRLAVGDAYWPHLYPPPDPRYKVNYSREPDIQC